MSPNRVVRFVLVTDMLLFKKYYTQKEKMEEEKKFSPRPVRTIQEDMERLRGEMSSIRFELSEIRAAFYNMVNEMRKQSRTFQGGMTTCHQAFLKCKDAYESCQNGYDHMAERVEDELTTLSGTMPMNSGGGPWCG